jgi:hypothetical protein
MATELDDEVTSINAIYGENALQRVATDQTIYALTFSAQPAVSLRVDFPANYPDAPPSVLRTQSVGDSVAKGDGAFLVDLVRDVLAEVYTPGAPCIYDLVEEVNLRIQQLGLDQDSRDKDAQSTQGNSQQLVPPSESRSGADTTQPLEDLGEEPPWTLSEVVSEKKSVFVARSAPVQSVDQAKLYLAHLLVTDKKVAKATHNISAWRIQGEHGVQYQDCDDDGETAAGGRVLHLLELMNVWNAMVVVTRWYGGVQLGPDRFRIINQTARDALVKAGFSQEASKEAGKKKGKK